MSFVKFRLKHQHYDMPAGSEWFDAGPVQGPNPRAERLVTKIEGDTSEGCFRLVPLHKLEYAYSEEELRQFAIQKERV